MITNKLGILNLLFFMLQLGLIRGDCDCQQLSDEVENLRIIVQIHTEKLANLVNYERKTGRLFQWFQTFNHNEGETPQNEDTKTMQESIHQLMEKTDVITETMNHYAEEWQNISSLSWPAEKVSSNTKRSTDGKYGSKSNASNSWDQQLINLNSNVTTLLDQHIPQLETRISNVESNAAVISKCVSIIGTMDVKLQRLESTVMELESSTETDQGFTKKDRKLFEQTIVKVSMVDRKLAQVFGHQLPRWEARMASIESNGTLMGRMMSNHVAIIGAMDVKLQRLESSTDQGFTTKDRSLFEQTVAKMSMVDHKLAQVFGHQLPQLETRITNVESNVQYLIDRVASKGVPDLSVIKETTNCAVTMQEKVDDLAQQISHVRDVTLQRLNSTMEQAFTMKDRRVFEQTVTRMSFVDHKLAELFRHRIPQLENVMKIVANIFSIPFNIPLPARTSTSPIKESHL